MRKTANSFIISVFKLKKIHCVEIETESGGSLFNMSARKRVLKPSPTGRKG